MSQLHDTAQLHARTHPRQVNNPTLVPGSALPYKEWWQELASDLPTGSVLIVLPDGNPAQKAVLLRVARLLADEGHQVRVVPETEMPRRRGVLQGQLPLPTLPDLQKV